MVNRLLLLFSHTGLVNVSQLEEVQMKRPFKESDMNLNTYNERNLLCLSRKSGPQKKAILKLGFAKLNKSAVKIPVLTTM